MMDFATFCTKKSCNELRTSSPNLVLKIPKFPHAALLSVAQFLFQHLEFGLKKSCANATQNRLKKKQNLHEKKPTCGSSVIHLKQVETKIQRLKSLNHRNQGSLSSPGNMHIIERDQC